MESVLGRYRNLIVLMGVLFLQVLGLAVQVKRGADAENTRLIRVWAIDVITPFERSVVWVQNGTRNIWHNYFYLRGVRAENRELKEQIERMRIEQVRLSEDAAQARRLQTLLAFKEQFISKTVAAQVIGASGNDLSRMIYIDKGSDSGIKREMAVITADGIVGKVMLVYPSVAQVLLINDQTSGVGVILEKSRLQGVLRGTPNGEVMLERVMSDEEVPVGETVLTSGGDQIFPKGLAVGTVTNVANGKDLFLSIKIKPAANLNKLEEVLVLIEKQERQPVADDKAHVRASDILAQRLPSVPDKPADASSPSGTGSSPAKSGISPSTGTKPAGTAQPQAARSVNTATTQRGPGATSAGEVSNGSAKPVSSAAVKSGTSPKPAAVPTKPGDEPAIKLVPPTDAPPATPPQQSTPPPAESNPQ